MPGPNAPPPFAPLTPNKLAPIPPAALGMPVFCVNNDAPMPDPAPAPPNAGVELEPDIPPNAPPPPVPAPVANIVARKGFAPPAPVICGRRPTPTVDPVPAPAPNAEKLVAPVGCPESDGIPVC